ncbi:sensor histidine kinase [Paraburkholderia humisilvae]|uniref:histidine kinase n=1 Tax=Paraburkholderia humisilvae TaxID=627669 RepID=A0A6J5D9H8_9BURK|nr:ATP-binding protein [Paraburkholderia humisilvae]CAB3750898.1 Adaptive-response sensory-kinase SasA [Paraburkholderia humisilvae]
MVAHPTYSYSAATTGLRHYAVALLLTAGATLLAWFTKAHASCYLLAVIMSSLYGGRAAGLVTLASSLVCFIFLIALPPANVLAAGEIPRLIVFVIVCVIVNDLVTSRRKARSALHERASQAPGTSAAAPWTDRARTGPATFSVADEFTRVARVDRVTLFGDPVGNRAGGFARENVAQSPGPIPATTVLASSTSTRGDAGAAPGPYSGVHHPPAQVQDTSEEALRNAIDSFPCMVVITDAEGRLQYANRQVLQFVGKEASELIDSGCTHLLHADDASRVIAGRRRSHETGIALTTTYRLRRHDGEYRWIETRMQPLHDAQGRIVRWYGVHMDVHESMTTAHALRDTQAQLSRASQIATVAELSASIAHEVNQPLAAMVTNGHACLNWLRAKQPNLERAATAAERIVRDGTTAAEVIRRIRALFRQAQPIIGPFDINATIHEVLGLMHRELRHHQIALELDLDAALPALNADRLQIQQTLFNLVDNAIDALRHVAVHRRRLVIRSTRDGIDHLLIEIRDHGPGLDDTNHIFQPFFTTKQDGMGMGLAICRSIIEAHGGLLWATNREDPGRGKQGATLHLRLPFAHAQRNTMLIPIDSIPVGQLHGQSR